MVSDTFHFALICTFIAIKIVSPLRGLKLDNAIYLPIKGLHSGLFQGIWFHGHSVEYSAT